MRAVILFFALFHLTLFSQDSTVNFAFSNFIEVVKGNHPIAYQAQLQSKMGDAKLLKSKGGFDPKINGSASQKYFDDKQYYSHLHAGLKIPTWFGITAQVGYRNNSGERLNLELYTPQNAGIWYAGLSLNLGNGLFIDARRAELKQAEIYQNSSRLEQRLILNQLILDASIAYWDWFKAYNKFNVYSNALVTADARLDAVRESAALGDKAYVDTLKALLQVQERSLSLEQSKLDLDNKKALLEVYLWQDGFVPLELDSNIAPNSYANIDTSMPPISVLMDLDTLAAGHPEIILAQNKIALSQIDYRLKKEALKPVAQLKYNALSTPLTENVLASYSVENYNWGAHVSYPIFTRKERGDLKLTELKLEEQNALMQYKTAEINYKIEATYNTWSSTHKQVAISTATLKNYTALYQAELTLFNIGESSLFLLNTRDMAMIDAQVKLIDRIYQNYLSKVIFNYQTVNY
ncbi:MAG: outer membrane protein TolC [Crocinitomix sp.]|jgi:outer membrane protein TolC